MALVPLQPCASDARVVAREYTFCWHTIHDDMGKTLLIEEVTLNDRGQSTPRMIHTGFCRHNWLYGVDADVPEEYVGRHLQHKAVQAIARCAHAVVPSYDRFDVAEEFLRAVATIMRYGAKTDVTCERVRGAAPHTWMHVDVKKWEFYVHCITKTPVVSFKSLSTPITGRGEAPASPEASLSIVEAIGVSFDREAPPAPSDILDEFDATEVDVLIGAHPVEDDGVWWHTTVQMHVPHGMESLWFGHYNILMGFLERNEYQRAIGELRARGDGYYNGFLHYREDWRIWSRAIVTDRVAVRATAFHDGDEMRDEWHICVFLFVGGAYATTFTLTSRSSKQLNASHIAIDVHTPERVVEGVDRMPRFDRLARGAHAHVRTDESFLAFMRTFYDAEAPEQMEAFVALVRALDPQAPAPPGTVADAGSADAEDALDCLRPNAWYAADARATEGWAMEADALLLADDSADVAPPAEEQAAEKLATQAQAEAKRLAAQLQHEQAEVARLAAQLQDKQAEVERLLAARVREEDHVRARQQADSMMAEAKKQAAAVAEAVAAAKKQVAEAMAEAMAEAEKQAAEAAEAVARANKQTELARANEQAAEQRAMHAEARLKNECTLLKREIVDMEETLADVCDVADPCEDVEQREIVDTEETLAKTESSGAKREREDSSEGPQNKRPEYEGADDEADDEAGVFCDGPYVVRFHDDKHGSASDKAIQFGTIWSKLKESARDEKHEDAPKHECNKCGGQFLRDGWETMVRHGPGKKSSKYHGWCLCSHIDCPNRTTEVVDGKEVTYDECVCFLCSQMYNPKEQWWFCDGCVAGGKVPRVAHAEDIKAKWLLPELVKDWKSIRKRVRK